MVKIEFPKPLKNLLDDSPLQPHIRDYANRAGEILALNELAFFTGYTDHGVDHINQVLRSEVDLVPPDVWTKSGKDAKPRLLNPEDAVVLIGATLLHDIAMHLQPDGFLELVGETTRFQPLDWFKDEQEGIAADRPWRELWLDFEREARRFNDRNLGNIIGLESVRNGWKFDKLPENLSQWEPNHKLIIGEFIRRHHARLAHEIAIYGFPGMTVGLNEGDFPALGAVGNPLQHLADLIGLAARSHGLSLRVCQAYLDASQSHARTPRPMNCAILYPMALLRVADYLQIDNKRAPAALLKLKSPQSPISVQEWEKHRAVQSISPASDPRGIKVTVNHNISHSIYLQLRELLNGLQAEMDHATAVLDEAYGTYTHLGLDQLNLAIRRIHSNLNSPAFRNKLPYVPESTGFAADPNLLTLLVEPLYGKEPSVGVRELMQNAVDAVRELHAWCKTRGIAVESLDLPEQDSDVQIDLIKREDGTLFLRVTDKGIGMTADTIQNYFLRAGASFRQSKEWSKEFLDEEGKPKVLRAGRFGVGAFAVFLLGSNFRLLTRHAGEPKGKGYFVEASVDCQLIEIRNRTELLVGTTIEVDISQEDIAKLELQKDIDSLFLWEGYETSSDWFCWDWPVVSRRITTQSEIQKLSQTYFAPISQTLLPPEWSVIYPKEFDAIYWTFEDYPPITCNGLIIGNLSNSHFEYDFIWPEEKRLVRPNIAVLDSAANLPLTIQRYDLSDKNLSFINELCRDVIFSFIAHALICSSTSRMEAHFFENQISHPLQIKEFETSGSLLSDELRWCLSSQAFIPIDTWLYSLLETPKCFVSGVVNIANHRLHQPFALSRIQPDNYNSLLFCNFLFECNKNDELFDYYPSTLCNYLSKIFIDIFQTLGEKSPDGQILISLPKIWQIKSLGEFISKAFKATFESLNEEVVGEQTLLSFPTKLDELAENYYLNSNVSFGKFKPRNSNHQYFSFQTGIKSDSIPTEQLIELLENQNNDVSHDVIQFIVEIKTQPSNIEPETRLAKIWNECLGTNPIPFDPIARHDLIEKGRQHPELKIHIEKWEEMKRTGSKWVVGNGKT